MAALENPTTFKVFVAATSIYNPRTKHFYHSWAIQLCPEDRTPEPYTYCALRQKDVINPDADKKIGVTNLFKREGHTNLIYNAIAEIYKIIQREKISPASDFVVYLSEKPIVNNLLGSDRTYLNTISDFDNKVSVKLFLDVFQPSWRFLSDRAPGMKEVQMLANKKAIEFENAHLKEILERIYNRKDVPTS